MGNGSSARKVEAREETAREGIRAERDRQIAAIKERQEIYAKEAEQKLEKIKNKHAQDLQKQITARQEAQQAHIKEMERLKRIAEEQDKQKKIQQKNEAVSAYTLQLNQHTNSVTENKRILHDTAKDLHQTSKSLDKLNHKIDGFDTYKQKELTKLAIEIELEKAKNEFDMVNNEIDAAIEKTSVHEDNIGRFLVLTQALLLATASNQANANKLNAAISVFGEILKREATPQLSIARYFEYNQLERITPLFAIEDTGLKNMDDLRCADEDEYNEILTAVNNGIKKQIDKWEQEQKEKENNNDNDDIKNNDNNSDDSDSDSDSDSDDSDDDDGNDNNKKKNEKGKPKPLNLREKRKLKQVCLHPQTWEEEQNSKSKHAKDSLNEIAPPMAKFFSTIYNTMQQTQQMLSFTPKMNDEQLKAINDMEKMDKIKPITYDLQENKQDDEDDNNTIISSNLKSDNDEEEFEESKNMEIDINENNDRIKNLQLEKVLSSDKLVHQTSLLSKAAIVSINVVESMMNEFIGSAPKSRALNLANGVETTCMEIVRSQGQICQAIVLSRQILSLKPANMSDTSKVLWSAVDRGIIQIFSNALEMSEVSAKYFGFFLKFNNSFQYFLSCNAQDASLLVSLEYLSKDIKEFTKFHKKFDKRVKKLGKTAMDVIQKCVETSMGAESFEKARNLREIKLKKYLDTKKIYDKKDMELTNELDQLLQKCVDLGARNETLKFRKESIEKQVEWDQTVAKQLQNEIQKLNAMVF